MLSKIVLASATLCVAITSAVAIETKQGAAPCGKLDDGKVRAACLRAAASLRETAQTPSPIEATADAVVPLGAASFVNLDRRVLFASPGRFMRKPLRLRGARCSYADVGEYMCAWEGRYPVEVHAVIVVPPPAQSFIETRCGTLNSPRVDTCFGTISLVPNAIETEMNKGRQKIVIRTSALTLALDSRVAHRRVR